MVWDYPVEQEQVCKLVKQFKETFSEAGLNALGKAFGFCKRRRDIRSYRLRLGRVEGFAAGKLERIGDIHRACNARWQTDVRYKPFYNQLAKVQFPEFMGAMCRQSLEQLACEALHFTPLSRCARFECMEPSSNALKRVPIPPDQSESRDVLD